MMVFLTGRERTITITGESAGAAYNNNIYSQAVPLEVISRIPAYELIVLGVRIRAWTGVIFAQPLPFRSVVGERVRIDTEWGTEIGEYSQEYNAPAAYQGSIDGEWAITATLQECVEIEEEEAFTLDDIPARVKLRFFERLKPESELEISASAGGASAALNVQVPANAHVEILANSGFFSAYVGVVNEGDSNYQGECTLSYDFPLQPADPNFEQSQEVQGKSRTIRVADSYVRASVAVTGAASPPEWSATAAAWLYAPKEADFLARIYAIDENYPQSLKVALYEKRDTWIDININSGAGARTIQQRRWQIASTLYGSPADYSINEWDSVRALIKPESLAEAKDDTNAYRLFGHGWLFDGIRIRHYTRTILDECNALSNSQREWAPVQQCTLSAGGGVITIAPTGAAPIVRRTCLSPAAERFNSYAYLRARVRAQANNANIELRIGAKRYARTTGVAANIWTDIYFDLCAPTNAEAVYDLQSSLYPEGRPDGEYWGVTQASEIRFALQSCQWEFDEISLDVLPWQSRPAPFNMPNHSLSLMPARGYTEQRMANLTIRRFITGQSDGKQALELEDAFETGALKASRSISWIHEEINRVQDDITRWLGWESELLAPAPEGCTGNFDPIFDCYLNRQRPATWLGGAGLTYHGTSWLEWAGRLQLPATSSLEIPAQALYDEIDWYPGIGDAWDWGNNEYGEKIKLAFGAILRGRAYGLILDDMRMRFDQGDVRLEREGEGDSGGEADLEDWGGMFQTGAPYACGTYDYILRGYNQAANLIPTARRYYTRLPLRTVATLTAAAPILKIEIASERGQIFAMNQESLAWIDQFLRLDIIRESWSEATPLALAYSARIGNLYALRKSQSIIYLYAIPTQLEEVEAMLQIAARTATLSIHPDACTLILHYENQGNINVRHSYDLGATWTTAQAISYNNDSIQGELLDSRYDSRSGFHWLLVRQGANTLLIRSIDMGFSYE